MYVCMYVYIYVYIYVYTHTHTHTHTHAPNELMLSDALVLLALAWHKA
jgi:hypothetical protein